MFVGGLITESSWLQNHAGKALALDVTVASLAFTAGILMMTSVIPGGLYGAIPNAVSFTFLAVSLVVGASYIMYKNRQPKFNNNYEYDDGSLKNKNKRFHERFENITKDLTAAAETKKLLSAVNDKLKEPLTPDKKRELETLKGELEATLGIKHENNEEKKE